MLKSGHGICVGPPMTSQPWMRGGAEYEATMVYLRQYRPREVIPSALRIHEGVLQLVCTDGRVIDVGPDDAAVLATGQRVEGAGEGSYERRAKYNKDGLFHVA